MSRLLRVLTALFALVFAVDAFAAGYSCPTYKKYTSCASGYYMTKGGTYNGTPVAGNACTSCPRGYTCAGGTADKKISTVTCSAGQYINGTTCKTCEAGYRCNGQTTYTPNGGVQGRTACSGSTEYQNSTGQTSCKAVSTGYYKSSNTAQTQCPSGYQVGAGAANQNSCVGNFTKTGSQIAPTAVPTNCKAITASGSCTPGTCTYKKNYAGTITSNCTATNCTKPITGVSAKTGYRTNGTTCTACPSGYPNSADGNTGGITACYSNNKSRPWSGNQTACSKPSNAYSVTCNSCSGSACTYVAYSNSAGNGDGTIKSGCSSNSAACQQTVKSVTCNANYRVNGTSCTACPSGYPNSAANNSGGITACYSNNKSRAWTGGQTACGKPSNCASVTCNSCSGSACTYVAYSNSAGTGDGTIKSGCSSNSANCQQSVKSVTANAGYYANGTACTICPAGKYCTGGTAAAANCAAGTFRSTTGGTAASSCSACTGATYSGVGATGCTNCPSGYTANTSARKTAASQCQINVAGGKYIATANTTTQTKCAANTWKSAHTVNYGSTSGCTACPTGYGVGAGAGTAQNTCYISVPAGQYLGTANGTTKSNCVAGTYKAAHNVTYGSTSSCAVCGTNTYSNAQAGSCTACATGNKYYNSGTAAANHAGVGSCVVSCAAGTYVASGGAACTSVGTGYYRAAHTVAQGSTSTRTQCPANYRAGAATGAESGCAASCAAGQYVPTAKAACTSVGTGYYRAAHTVTYGNTSTRTQCPDGYRNGGATGAESSCVMAVAAGKYVGTSKSATQTSCAAGTYKAAHTVNYGSTSSCAACTTRTKYSGAGAGACSTVSGGYYTTGCNASGNNCTGQSQCTGANYCSGGVSNACPSGYTANTSAGKTAASQCQINVAGGKYIATANTTTQTKCAANTWKSAHTVNYGSTSGCTACPTGYGVGAGAGTAQNTCYISVPAGQYLGTANGTTKSNCVAGTYKAAHNVTYGSTSSCAVCGTNTYSNAQAGSCTACATGNKYYNSGTAAANHAGVGSCVVSCAAGTYVASGGAACTSVGTGYYRAAHTVAQGSTSTRTQCPANYRAGAATGAESGCAASCAAGQYVPTAKAACTSVGTGYYRAAHTVTYGNTSTRTQCPDGYRNGGATGAESSCVMAVAAGKYVGTSKSATQTSCAAGTSKAAHNVTYGNTSSCAACTGATYSGAGAGSCTNCPSGYTANTASNKTAASQCQISVAGGKYVATANSATLTTCDAGYACPGGNVNYGSTGARNKCTGVTYSGAGASACTTCPNSATGYYIAGDIHTTINSCYKNVPWTGSHGNGTRNCYYTSGTGTSAVYSSSCDAYKASKCAAAYYYVSGADCTSVGTGYWSAADSITRTQCPANYQVGAAASAQSGCKTNCAAGTRVATANAACSAITSGNVYMLAHSVNYGATSAAATACPTGYSISGTTAADHDAKNDCKISCGAGTRVASADAVCTTPSGNWYVGAHTVAAGSTSSVNSCLANYTISGTAAADHDAASDCRISCGAGTRIVSANATSCTTPSGNWYVGAHTVPQGSTSSVNSCLANYSISGTAATNHDAAADCKISCSGGTYIAAANNTSCSNVGAGYWAAASTVSQGSAGARNQCASGLTTIGYGAGADEAGDCGRILNVGTDKVYLRSTKKTTPSLNIKIGDQTYYGNMSTATKGKLRVKNGTTTYSVHDDSK